MERYLYFYVFLQLFLLHSSVSVSVWPRQPPISVYWVSSPTHVNETLLIAGAGLDQASPKLCRDVACHFPIDERPNTSSWKQSLSFVLPEACATPPCYLVFDQGASLGTQSIEVNAPDVWWGLSGAPSTPEITSANNLRTIHSNKPHDIHVTIGDDIRIFGRSLAWSSGRSRCIPTIGSELFAVPSTRLVLHPSMAKTTLTNIGKNVVGVPAFKAGCYEATFSSTGMVAGNYPDAVIITPWGMSQKLNITLVSPPPKPTLHRLDVGASFGGNLSLAIAQANLLVTADPKAAVDVVLGTRRYFLHAPVILPNRTRLLGSGVDNSILVFYLAAPVPSRPRCSAPKLTDFFTQDCKRRGCMHHRCPGCFLQIGTSSLPSTIGECCAACVANQACNAWTFIGDLGEGRGSLCEFNSCPDEPTAGRNSSCASTPSSPGPNNRTSGWVLGRTRPKTPPTAAIVVGGRENSLVNFSVKIQSAPALMPAVAMQPSATSFLAEGLNITLLQVSQTLVRCY